MTKGYDWIGVQENILLTGCQVLLWNKPIKSNWNQSVQLHTKTSLEISIDFGLENMLQNVAKLD